jgi:hypothetical protein
MEQSDELHSDLDPHSQESAYDPNLQDLGRRHAAGDDDSPGLSKPPCAD